MRKTILVLFLIYFFQLMITSCFRCGCGPTKIFERTYDAIELFARDRNGSINNLQDSVHKNSFSLGIGFQFKLNQVASYNSIFHLSSFGLAMANATTCNCPYDEFINIDPIHSIIITVIDTETQETLDVTNNFYVNAYSSEESTISEFLENEEHIDSYEYFKLDMKQPEIVPDTSIFNVKVILESGLELNKQTQVINFE